VCELHPAAAAAAIYLALNRWAAYPQRLLQSTYPCLLPLAIMLDIQFIAFQASLSSVVVKKHLHEPMGQGQVAVGRVMAPSRLCTAVD
jgi:hypothetical protein